MSKHGQKLLIATSNAGKVGEYRAGLADLHVELVSLKDLGLSSIEETGKTLEENAILKAKTYFAQSGLPCIADDGGFEIDYLHGEPGVKSHRWINGNESSDDELVAYTLKRLEGVPKEKRTARMRQVTAFIDTEGNMHTVTTAIEGIVSEQSAKNVTPGYPFRAVLYIPQFGKMYDDLIKEEHKAVNQRVLAIKKLKPIIAEALPH
jgi:XTP/dITP diphosphohydrolase